MDETKFSLRRTFFLALLFVGVSGEPIFFHGRGKEISRKRSFHPFNPRAPAHRPPPPLNRVPCAPNFAPRTKYVTKTTSLYKTIYETEFFPKTVFDTSFKTAPFDLDPSTVTKTSTTTSTLMKTKVEPVYVTTTEIETTSMTSTVTHLVYDTRQHISSLLHTRIAPEVLTQTIVQDVYHTDVETIFSSKTVTVTRTQNLVKTDCPALPSSSSYPPFVGNQFDPRGKFNREYLRTAFLHAPLDPDPYSDITHANSEPPKTYAGPIPFDEHHGKGTFNSLYSGARTHFSHVDPLSYQLHPPYGGSYVPPAYASLTLPENKLINSFAGSNPNPSYYEGYLLDGDYSSSHHSVAESPVLVHPSDDETDDLVPFKATDTKFAPSRPDPTSISDIIDSPYGIEEEKDDYSYKARQPKLLQHNEESLYGTKSIYTSKPHGYDNPMTPDSLHMNYYSDYDGEIHVKELLKGVKGGEIHEEIHKHGIVAHDPVLSVAKQHSLHVPQYSGSYHDSPPVYEYKNIDPHYDVSQARTENVVEATSHPNSQYDPLSKQVHPLLPNEMEYNGSVKSRLESYDRKEYTKSPAIGAKSLNHNSLSPSVKGPYHLRTIFRSDVLGSKRIAPHSHSFQDAYGAHSMPVVTNLAGTEYVNLYKNTSSNTYVPSRKTVIETDAKHEDTSPTSEVGEYSTPIDIKRHTRESQASEGTSTNFYGPSGWKPLVSFESQKNQ